MTKPDSPPINPQAVSSLIGRIKKSVDPAVQQAVKQYEKEARKIVKGHS